MAVLSGTAFCKAIENANARKPLTNADGYPLPRYRFADVEDATFFYGETLAKSTFVVVDSNRNFMKIAPIVADDNGEFANGLEVTEVFPDDIVKI